MLEQQLETRETGLEVAVIGMAGRFPGARNIHEFWENLKNGVESITFFTDEALIEMGFDSSFLENPNVVKARGYFAGIEYFDAAFFGYTPAEATVMDPQIRFLHECAWEALEDAGCDPDTYDGLIGVYVGATDNVHWRSFVLWAAGMASGFVGSQFAESLLSNKDLLCSRLSYQLNLTGPSYTVNSACSTSLVAIHRGCRGLLGGECDMALAGGVSITVPQKQGYLYQEGMIESPDGHCRAFDAQANGTVFGSGIGVVILKRLDEAIEQGNHIYAVIKGTAVNNDGKRKVGYTAPSVEGQTEVIRAAYQVAEVDPDTIGYIEAHGTGTALGDPIEIKALVRGMNRTSSSRCPIGAVKTNVGHLDTAAGAAGFIKAVLCLRYRIIPPTLHFKTPNPELELEKTPFYVNTELMEWERQGNQPLRAGVSSFGIGGTNAHAILEEWHEGRRSDGQKGERPQLILLSAKTASALDKMTENLANYLKKNLINPDFPANPVNPGFLGDVAYTLQKGRKAFIHRKALVCSTVDEAIEALANPGSPAVQTLVANEEFRHTVFMFSGQGSQYVNMGLELYQEEPVFREEIDRCFDILTPMLGVSIKEVLYPPATCNLQPAPDINQTEIAQPVIFAFEYALTKLLMSWGITADAMIGHSIGEYVAACLSGVFSLEDALDIVVQRGKLMQQIPGGAMLSVSLPEQQLEPMLAEYPDLALAAVNSSSLCVVSGPHEAIEKLERELNQKNHKNRRLHTSHAFHSSMMDTVVKPFEAVVGKVTLEKPNIPFLSNVTGEWVTVRDAVDPRYWARHLRQTVRFSDGLAVLLGEENRIFLEVGPGNALSTFVRQHKDKKLQQVVINLVRHPGKQVSDIGHLLYQIGRLWLHRQKIDWQAFHSGNKRYLVPLPTYPFDQKRYWLDSEYNQALSDDSMDARRGSRTTIGARAEIDDWFYLPSWKRSNIRDTRNLPANSNMVCLIFSPGSPNGNVLAASLEERLKQGGVDSIVVCQGTAFERRSRHLYSIDPREACHYDLLVEELCKENRVPQGVFHLWNVTKEKELKELTNQKIEDAQYSGFYSLIYLAQAIGSQSIEKPIRILVVSNHMQEVMGEEVRCPGKATLLGPVKVISQEYPNIQCRSVDIDIDGDILPNQNQVLQRERLIRRLFTEMLTATIDSVIAYRSNQRWAQVFEPVSLEKSNTGTPYLRDNGVYLLIGGLGGIGLVLAEHFARQAKVKLIMTSRSGLPDRQQGDKLRELEEMGAEVLVMAADVLDRQQMEGVIRQAKERYGTVNGVIHAAGVADYGGVIQGRRDKKRAKMSEAVLAPKLKGTIILEILMKEQGITPDFMVLCSSIASIAAPFGEVAYNAANAFLDAYAHYYYNYQGLHPPMDSARAPESQDPHQPMVYSIDWSGWQQVGMAVEAVKRRGQDPKTTLRNQILPSEGVEVFDRILNSEFSQVVVSPLDLNLLLQQPLKLRGSSLVEPLALDTDTEIPLQGIHRRPELGTPYAAPENEIQQKLVQIWQRFFGLEQVGINDDFFDLGGDSLKATVLISRIHKELDVNVSLAEIFDNPTIKDLGKRIDASIKKKFVPIEAVEEKEYYPVSSAQKRLYFHYRLNVHSIDYNLVQIHRLEGEINAHKLERIFNTLIRRHESLRTSFHTIAGEPVQRIQEGNSKFQITNSKGGGTPGRIRIPNHKFQIPNEIENFVQPFDLSKAPLLHVGLIRLEQDQYIVIVDMHHIISDATSQGILTTEFMLLYQGIELLELKVRYRDYTHWQQRKQQTGDIKKQETYWLQQFAGDIPLLDMPTDYPHPAPGSRTYEGGKVAFQIDKETLEKINHLVSGEGMTLFFVLLAVFNILLSKYTGKQDIVVGTGSAGRRHTDLAGIIGIFIHVLPMRNHPGKYKTFFQFLREVKMNALDAYDNEDYPFEELVKALNIQGKTPLNPLFDAAFELVNMELPENSGKGMSMNTSFEEVPQAAHYDITIYAIKTPNSVEMVMVYAKELFKPSTAKKMADHYMEILHQVLANVNIEISGMDVLTEGEKQQLLFEFNRFAADDTFIADYPGDKLIHQVFEEQVEKTPDRVAVVGSRQLAVGKEESKPGIVNITYKELNERANGLAHVLRSKGVIADTLVALMVDPSIETAVGILGILKAGGAYLPIHHETPSERFLSILKDSRVSLALTKTGILRKQSFTALQGLRRQEMKLYRTKPRPSITDFDTIPFPDRSLVNYEKYNRYIGHNLIHDCISLQATRGCPFNCAYCHKIWPKKHVARSAENVFQEVLFNYNLGIRRFSFVDDIFNYNRKNSQRFFELIIEHQLDLHLFFLMRGDMLTREYIDLMVEAGLIRLGLALETASPRLQKLIGKHLNIEKLRANIEYITEKYPQVILELYTMHGFPSETKEEAMKTMNFIKSIKWLHFPYIFILTIFPNTEMEKLALDNGIPAEAIDRSLNLAYHELPDTLPFEKDFTIKYQAEFLNDYFLSKERLLHVLPLQMKNLTEAEMVQKYNSYLPIDIKSFDHMLEFFNLRREELTVKECMEQKRVFVPHLNAKLKAAFPTNKPAESALRLLLLDLSQNFSTVHGRLDEMIEPPLGLMYLMTFLNYQYQGKINGKIAKSMIDFDSFTELKALLQDFKPQVIGIRTLSLYHDFFHETVQKIRQWGITAPILTGGPYATSSYHTLLQDPNIDLVVLGEGEITLAELMGKILENNGKLPTEEELKEIAGIVFIPQSEKKPGKYAREIITLDDFTSDHLSHYAGALPSGFTENPEPVNQPHHLVYSIYTSGSTGLPKGVMLEHRHLSRLVYGLKERIYSRYNQPLSLSLIAPYVFDASVKQIFAALVQGHTLHIVPDEVRVDGPALLQFYKEHCIDVSDGTPTLIRLLLETLAQIKADNGFLLKHLIIGGEALPKEKVRELFDRCKENRLTITNVYGPTECTVDSTSFEITAQSLENQVEIPIGKPMPFDFIYILDREGRLVPIGVPGELCIGGFKVARGYLNNPELTAEKFVLAHSSWLIADRRKKKANSPGELPMSYELSAMSCFYKTGDLARWLSDGNIEFLGRMDRQVKIRGLRIELGEIENRIAALYEIKEAVVTARTDEQGDSFLCAYIVPETRIDVSQLRRILSHYLPDYMVPAYFVPMAELPFTPGGKIDRNALPHPDDLESTAGQLAAPRNPIEEQLVEITKKVLGRKNVGIYENIFTIGADSIKTIQIAYGMKEAGYNVEIRDIFENPTAAALAPKVSEIKRMADQSVVTGVVPLSPVQEEFFDIYRIDPHHFNHSVMFYSEERLDPGALEAVVIKLQEHHDALRMTYKTGENGQIIQWNHGLEYPHWFRVYDYRNRSDALAVLAEECNRIQASIDLEKGPLLKIALFQLDDGDRLLAALHHLVVDGMSWRILFEDIGALYNHYKNHPATQQPKLPPKSDSFKLWGERIREYADRPEFLAEKNYWAHVEASPVELIKRDLPGENAFIKDLHNLSFALTEEETETLFSRVNPALDTEITDILLTGLGAAFKKVCGQERLLVALEGHGREEILEDVDVGRTVGWFTSIYPVVLDFSQELELTLRVREVKGMLHQVPNKGIGYGILKYITAGEHKKEIEFKLKPQIGFNYLGQFDTDVGHLSFVMAKESPGHTYSLEGIRKYDFTVTGIVGARRLVISIAYSRKQYKPETVKAVLDYYQEVLRAIIQAF